MLASRLLAVSGADSATPSCYDTAALGPPVGGAIFNQRSSRANDTSWQRDYGDHLSGPGCQASHTLRGPADSFAELRRKVKNLIDDPAKFSLHDEPLVMIFRDLFVCISRHRFAEF